MANKGDKVWCTKTLHGFTVYTNEKDARKEYLYELNYCKTHSAVTESDHWVYNVWHEEDEPTGSEMSMHYACIEATDEYGNKRNYDIHYGCRIIQ